MSVANDDTSPLLLLHFASAGWTINAVTFGFARYGYGLFLPEIGRDFGLGKDWLGLIASAAYAGYMTATILSLWLCARLGPRFLISAGGLLAAIGTMLVAIAPMPAILALGVVLSGASAGFVYAPLSEAVTRCVPHARQNRAWTTINSGVAGGIVLAGIAAIVFAAHWRLAWFYFSTTAAFAALWNGSLMPSAHADGGSSDAALPRLHLRWFLHGKSFPLFCLSFSSGLVTTIFWTFATSLIVSPETSNGHATIAFGLTAETLRICFWTLLGVAGFTGAAAGDLITCFGLKRVVRTSSTVMAAAIGLFTLMPENPAMLCLTGLAFGATFTLTSGTIGVWSLNVFNSRPAAGFGATFLIFSVGALAGPAIAGAGATHFGLPPVFYAIMIGSLMMATLTPREDIRSITR